MEQELACWVKRRSSSGASDALGRNSAFKFQRARRMFPVKLGLLWFGNEGQTFRYLCRYGGRPALSFKGQGKLIARAVALADSRADHD